MHKLFSFVVFFLIALCYAQPNTDVFLFDLNTVNGKFEISNMRNVSNNKGYDNQPSFLDNNTILYAGTRNGQTDIVKYNINYNSKIYINHTNGSEYSPLKIPNQKAVSAILLDKDGRQALYKYSLKNGESEVLVDNIIIGYHVWYNKNIIVSSVLEDGGLSLYTTNFKSEENQKMGSKIGRSLHNIPNTKLISYISKQNDNWEIKSLDPKTGNTKWIANTLPKKEDMCWLTDGKILMGKDAKLFTIVPNKDTDWTEVASLSSYNITNISRMIVSPDGTKLAIVGEGGQIEIENVNKGQPINNSKSNAGDIVQKHIEPYNNGNLDAFANAFSENVVVSNFANQPMYKGRLQLKQNYQRFFQKNKNLSVLVNNRIVLNDKVIDEEIGTVNFSTNRHVTIYTTSKNGIESMTFIQNQKTDSTPEYIVNKQLEAYNKRDIEAFMATYTNDVKLYNYPNELRTDGQLKIYQSYKKWFDQTLDLKATIKKRIVIGNKVIDLEEVKANGKTFQAVAIYEIENNKIKKVTFLR